MIQHDHSYRHKNNNQHRGGSICRKFSTLVRADAVKTYIDGVIATADALVYKGVIDCSTTEDTTNELILVGVTSGATTTLKRDTNVTVTNDSIKANNFKMGTSAYMTYNSSTECIEFIFN